MKNRGNIFVFCLLLASVIIMNSCVSTEFVACAPPFKIFIIGTGR